MINMAAPIPSAVVTPFENDMVCLVDSLLYLKDDEQQQIQALDHLAEMCLQEGGAALFNKTNGLSTVFKIAFNKTTKISVLQKALFTLGNAVLQSDDNKGILFSDQMLNFIKCNILNEHQDTKSVASASYFLACICTNNEKAQSKVRKSRCLERLVNLYKAHHPRGSNTNDGVEEWFDVVISFQSVALLNHISYALRSIINKPKNVENQLICSPLLNLATSSLSGVNIACECKLESLQLIADCVYENEKTQNIFNMIGGIRYLSKFFDKQLEQVLQAGKQNMKMDLLVNILDTLSAAITENEACKKSAGKSGIIKLLLKCVENNFEHVVCLKSLICLSDIVHECVSCQTILTESDGIATVINIMSLKQDDIVSKIGTSILQSCVKSLEDMNSDQKVISVKDADEKEETMDNSLALLFDFFTGKKEKRNPQKSMSIENLLNSIQENQETPKQMKKLVNHTDNDQKNNKGRKQNLKENGLTVKRKKSQSIKKPVAIESDQCVVNMLKEQKEMIQSFQTEMHQLHDKVANQFSDCGRSTASRSSRLARSNHAGPISGIVNTVNQPPTCNQSNANEQSSKALFKIPQTIPNDQKHFTGTPSFRKHSINLSQCPRSVPARKHNFSVIPKEKSYTPLRSSNICMRNPINEDSLNNESNSVHNACYDYETDERPALHSSYLATVPTKQNPSSVRKCCPNTSQMSYSNSLVADNLTDLSFMEASAIEKVEKWRQSFSHESLFGPVEEHEMENEESNGSRRYQSYESDDHLFKVPSKTPVHQIYSDISSTPNQLQKSHFSFKTPVDFKINKAETYSVNLQNAPKKKYQTQRKRKFIGEECFIPITPETNSKLCDQTKRTLNFPTISRRKIGFDEKYNDQQLISEKQSHSSGFIDCSPRKPGNCSNVTSKEVRCFVGKENIETVRGANLKCIGCSPFQRFFMLYFNSRNLSSLIQFDSFTCDEHKQFVRSILSRNQAKNKLPTTGGKGGIFQKVKLKPYHRACNDNMSVFSFRSSRRSNQRDDDQMSVISNWTTTTNGIRRRRRQDYSDEEIQYILDGVERYGTRWTAIVNSYPFKANRTSVDLSDKYKQMRKRGLIHQNKFVTSEIENLRRGVYKHGYQWKRILEDYEFQTCRTENDLKLKWQIVGERRSNAR